MICNIFHFWGFRLKLQLQTNVNVINSNWMEVGMFKNQPSTQFSEECLALTIWDYWKYSNFDQRCSQISRQVGWIWKLYTFYKHGNQHIQYKIQIFFKQDFHHNGM